MGSVKHLGESCTDESCLTGDSSKHEHQQLNPDSTTMPALIEKRYEEVSPSTLYFFKRSNLRYLSNELRVAIDDCILELSKVQPQAVLRNMRLTIQPDLNSDDRAVISSGNQMNRLVAFRDAHKLDDEDETPKLELVWYRNGPECKKSPIVFHILPYVIFALIVVGIYGFILSHFVLHDFKLRAQAEGVVTVRAYTADLHHDKLNEFYKLPMENSDGMVQYPYKGD